MRVRFIVLEKDIEARLVLFDQVRFEDQGFDFAVDHDKLEIRYKFYKLFGFWIVIAARLKV